VVDRVKELEARGFTFEAADASFELLLRDELGQRHEYFSVESWRVIVESHPDGRMTSEATVRLTAKGERLLATLLTHARAHDRRLDAIVGLRNKAEFIRTLRRIAMALV